MGNKQPYFKDISFYTEAYFFNFYTQYYSSRPCVLGSLLFKGNNLSSFLICCEYLMILVYCVFFYLFHQGGKWYNFFNGFDFAFIFFSCLVCWLRIGSTWFLVPMVGNKEPNFMNFGFQLKCFCSKINIYNVNLFHGSLLSNCNRFSRMLQVIVVNLFNVEQKGDVS